MQLHVRNIIVERDRLGRVQRLLWEERLPVTGYWSRNRQDFVAGSDQSQAVAGAKYRALRVAELRSHS